MLSRLRAPAVTLTGGVPAQMRAYSYFSQRPGRFFTSSKAAATTASYKKGRLGGIRGTSEPTSSSAADGAVDASGAPSSGGPDAAEHGDAHAHALSASGSAEQQSSESHQTNDRSSPSSTRMSSIPPTAPLFHPQPPLPSLHLHEFFAQHRPLLLLDQPLSNLFSPLQSTSSPLSSLSASSSSELPTAPAPSAFLSDAQAQIEDEAEARALSNLDFDTSSSTNNHGTSGSVSASSAEAEADADADVARILARSLVVQRIQASRDWAGVMTELGLASESEVQAQVVSTSDVVNLDSVKRKRRKKMNKHKYKKRRKVQRAERRRLGK